jgi:ketosteroid isomerase-like protein
VVKVTQLDLIPVVVSGSGGLVYEVGVQTVTIEPAQDSFKPKRKYLHVYERQPDGAWKR